jgi:hypothetical protein
MIFFTLIGPPNELARGADDGIGIFFDISSDGTTWPGHSTFWAKPNKNIHVSLICLHGSEMRANFLGQDYEFKKAFVVNDIKNVRGEFEYTANLEVARSSLMPSILTVSCSDSLSARSVTESVQIGFDTDGDGISDGAEIQLFHTDPDQQDTDRDGLFDGLEVMYGFDPKDRDSDDDGEEDLMEALDANIAPEKIWGIGQWYFFNIVTAPRASPPLGWESPFVTTVGSDPLLNIAAAPPTPQSDDLASTAAMTYWYLAGAGQLADSLS